VHAGALSVTPSRYTSVVKKRKDIPPFDSWITIKPGELLSMDPKLNAEWHRLKSMMREYRGSVLTDAFQIEMQVDRLLCEILFPASDDPNIRPEQHIPLTKGSASALRNLFDEFVLKASTMPTISFGYKIDLLANLAKQIAQVEAVVSPGLIKTLNKLRRIRNNFAHYPITFTLKGTAGAQTFQIVLATHKEEIAIDDAYIRNYGAMYTEVAEELNAATEALKSNPSREPDIAPETETLVE
jgi:hypothetical protein